MHVGVRRLASARCMKECRTPTVNVSQRMSASTAESMRRPDSFSDVLSKLPHGPWELLLWFPVISSFFFVNRAQREYFHPESTLSTVEHTAQGAWEGPPWMRRAKESVGTASEEGSKAGSASSSWPMKFHSYPARLNETHEFPPGTDGESSSSSPVNLAAQPVSGGWMEWFYRKPTSWITTSPPVAPFSRTPAPPPPPSLVSAVPSAPPCQENRHTRIDKSPPTRSTAWGNGILHVQRNADGKVCGYLFEKTS